MCCTAVVGEREAKSVVINYKVEIEHRDQCNLYLLPHEFKRSISKF